MSFTDVNEKPFDEILTAFQKAADILAPPSAHGWDPLPHQIPPNWRWYLWLLLGGRGSGKTAATAKYIHDHVHGPPCIPHLPGGHWISIVAPTMGDAVTSCVQGPSGLIAHDPGIRVINRPGGLIAKWSNGVEAKLFGAHTPEDVERFRAGGNRCIVWAEELAAWRYLDECWKQMRYGLRLGPWPRVVASTTPKNRMMLKELMKDETTAITRATTEDNPHLNEGVKNQLYKDYKDTRLGRQELLGLILEDIQGALWKGQTIEDHRVDYYQHAPEEYDRIVVAVDPAVSSNEHSNEHGIVTCGMVHRWHPENYPVRAEMESHGFVLADDTVAGTPTEWGRAAIRAFHEHSADLIVAEKNNGGDMVRYTINSIDPTVPVKLVHASRGKKLRAEPISALYEQGRVHHVGMFGDLEEQMTGWDSTDPDPSWSPDRMDALVWGLTELMTGGVTMQAQQMRDTRLRNRR